MATANDGEELASLRREGYCSYAAPPDLTLSAGGSKQAITKAFASAVRKQKVSMDIIKALYQNPTEMEVETSDDRAVFCYAFTLKPAEKLDVLIMYLWSEGSVVHVYPKSHTLMFQPEMRKNNLRVPDHIIQKYTGEAQEKGEKMPIRLDFPGGGFLLCDARTWLKAESGHYTCLPWTERSYIQHHDMIVE